MLLHLKLEFDSKIADVREPSLPPLHWQTSALGKPPPPPPPLKHAEVLNGWSLKGRSEVMLKVSQDRKVGT